MSIGDFLFGKSEKLKPQILQEPYQITGRKSLFETAEPGALERLNRAGEPYPGQLVAPLSSAEETGISQLGKYLDSPLPTEDPLYAMGKEEVSRTLGGEYYDPAEGQYYQALRKNVMRELAEAKDRLASRTAARDAFYGGGRIASEGELEETTVGGLAQILGSLYERERDKRLGVVPLATDLLSYEERAPLGRIAASQQFGALPREWEQSVLNAEREEYLRQLTDLGIPLEIALQLSTYRPDYNYQLYSSTPGLLGGPSGVSMQSTGGWGDAQRVQAVGGSLAQLFAGAGGGGGTGVGTPPGGWGQLRTQAGIN